MKIEITSQELRECIRELAEFQAPLVAAVEKLIVAVEKSALDAAFLTQLSAAIGVNNAALVAAGKDDLPTIEKHFADSKQGGGEKT